MKKLTHRTVQKPRVPVRGSALRAHKAGLINKAIYNDMVKRHPDKV
jgi:hypothetical protein